MVTAPNTDTALPMRVNFITLAVPSQTKLDFTLIAPDTANDEAVLTQLFSRDISATDSEFPILTRSFVERQLPKFTKSRILAWLPMRVTQNADNRLPSLAHWRRDKALPSNCWSKELSAEPNSLVPATDSSRPTRKLVLADKSSDTTVVPAILRLPPFRTDPNTVKVLPILVIARIDMAEPSVCESNIDIHPFILIVLVIDTSSPHLTTPSTETALPSHT